MSRVASCSPYPNFKFQRWVAKFRQKGMLELFLFLEPQLAILDFVRGSNITQGKSIISEGPRSSPAPAPVDAENFRQPL